MWGNAFNLCPLPLCEYVCMYVCLYVMQCHAMWSGLPLAFAALVNRGFDASGGRTVYWAALLPVGQWTPASIVGLPKVTLLDLRIPNLTCPERPYIHESIRMQTCVHYCTRRCTHTHKAVHKRAYMVKNIYDPHWCLMLLICFLLFQLVVGHWKHHALCPVHLFGHAALWLFVGWMSANQGSVHRCRDRRTNKMIIIFAVFLRDTCGMQWCLYGCHVKAAPLSLWTRSAHIRLRAQRWG